MNQIKLIKEPGYVSDLFFLFYLKYNTEHCMEHFVSKQNAEEDKAFFEQILREFAPISEDLFVFFHAIRGYHLCFMNSAYCARYSGLFTTEYNLEFVQRELSDYAEVTRRLVQFYFADLSEEALVECLGSKQKLFALVKESDYTDTEKSRLYEFFMDPVPYIQKLQYELLAKDVVLATYYEKNYDRILQASNRLTVDVLIEQLAPLRDIDFVKNDGAELSVSFSLLNRFYIRLFVAQNADVVLLGVDYLTGIEEAARHKESMKIDDFGTALCEASRVRMLDMMLERGEVSCKDMERAFRFSGSTAYHHLVILMKSGVIKTRNEGKTILYSVNKRHFELMLEELKKYTGK